MGEGLAVVEKSGGCCTTAMERVDVWEIAPLDPATMTA